MIGYFPEPYPDELLYSLIARFAERMHFPTSSGLMRMLFGRPHAVAITDLPHGLATLVKTLPAGHPATVDTLLDNHSQLPFFGPFLQGKTYKEVREAMSGSEDCSVRVRCGISTCLVRPPSHFRTCPACDVENNDTFGETFWNRKFQMKGVEVCVKHLAFLESTGLQLSPLLNRHQFTSAESSARKSVSTLIDPSNRTHQILLGLAQDIDWLLLQKQLNPGLALIHQRYVDGLRARGFVTAQGGSIRMSILRQELEYFFTPKLLELFDSTIPDTSTGCWLGRLLHKPTTAITPLRHLLLMRFLGVTPQQILCPEQNSSADRHLPESVSTWNCLNPVCTQFQKPAITKYTLEYMKKRKANAAILTCPNCRFSYGIYSQSKPAQKPDFVRDYGPQWRGRLKSSWLDSSVSVLQIAKLLAVDSKTVKSQALNLGLPFPRQGKRKATMTGIYIPKPIKPKFTVDLQRQKWLHLRQFNPGCGTNELRRLSPALYAWLYRGDRKWLATHVPPEIKAKSPLPRVDWARRDAEIAGQAATAALRIKNRSQKPSQVTVTAIGRAIGRQSLLEKHLIRLPYTRLVIQCHVESAEYFAVRRVTHAAAGLRLKLGIFERWQLVRAAGLRPATEKLPKVQAALDYESIHALTA